MEDEQRETILFVTAKNYDYLDMTFEEAAAELDAALRDYVSDQIVITVDGDGKQTFERP